MELTHLTAKRALEKAIKFLSRLLVERINVQLVRIGGDIGDLQCCEPNFGIVLPGRKQHATLTLFINIVSVEPIGSERRK